MRILRNIDARIVNDPRGNKFRRGAGDALRCVLLVKIPERFRYCFSVSAGMLNVIANRIAVAAQVDHHIIRNDPIIDRLAGTQLYIQAVRCGVVIEIGAHSTKSLSLNTL